MSAFFPFICHYGWWLGLAFEIGDWLLLFLLLYNDDPMVTSALVIMRYFLPQSFDVSLASSLHHPDFCLSHSSTFMNHPRPWKTFVFPPGKYQGQHPVLCCLQIQCHHFLFFFLIARASGALQASYWDQGTHPLYCEIHRLKGPCNRLSSAI